MEIKSSILKKCASLVYYSMNKERYSNEYNELLSEFDLNKEEVERVINVNKYEENFRAKTKMKLFEESFNKEFESLSNKEQLRVVILFLLNDLCQLYEENPQKFIDNFRKQ